MAHPETPLPPAQSRLHIESWSLAAVLLLHLALGIYYSIAIPIWEAHDEIGHYYFARYLAMERRLPEPGQQLVEQNDESRQPPLYYVLAALPIAITGDEDTTPLLNPHMSWPNHQGGANRVVHDWQAEAWPFRGRALAVHAARLVSVLLGAVALGFTYLALRVLFPPQIGLRFAALGLMALWPQFRFATAVLNNDILVTTAGAAVTWALLRALLVTTPRLDHFLLLGLTTGLALLSKNNALALLPAIAAVAVVLLVRVCRTRQFSMLLGLLAAGVLATCLVGWWYVRNLRGGTGTFGGSYSIQAARHILSSVLRGNVRWDLGGPALQQGVFSLWAAFGWNNVGLPLPLYWAAAAMATVAAVGLIYWSVRRAARQQALSTALLAFIIVSELAAWLIFAVQGERTDLPGRYVLPALPAIATLLATGLWTLLPNRGRRPVCLVLAGALTLQAILVPVWCIRPAYVPPRSIAETELAEYTPAHLYIGEVAELVAYHLPERFVDADGTVHLTLVWRPLAQTSRDYSLSIKVLGYEYELLGEVQRFPGQGALATSCWPVGQLFAEDVAIPVHNSKSEGRAAWIEISLFDRGNPAIALPTFDADGQPLGLSLHLDRLKIRGHSPQQAPAPGARFGPAIGLSCCQVAVRLDGSGQRIEVALLWTALQRPPLDYTVSLQLRDAEQQIVTQADSQPQGQRYPTSLWESGEQIWDSHELELPDNLAPGHYTLYLCVYHLATQERLPVTNAQEHLLPQDELPLLSIEVGTDGTVREEAQTPLAVLEE